jgi:hypothetical protein
LNDRRDISADDEQRKEIPTVMIVQEPDSIFYIGQETERED